MAGWPWPNKAWPWPRYLVGFLNDDYDEIKKQQITIINLYKLKSVVVISTTGIQIYYWQSWLIVVVFDIIKIFVQMKFDEIFQLKT